MQIRLILQNNNFLYKDASYLNPDATQKKPDTSKLGAIDGSHPAPTPSAEDALKL